MARRTQQRDDRPSHPPLWLVEGLDIVHRRRLVLLTITVATIVVAAIIAAVFPAVLPPRGWVGAALGVAALLLGLAGAVAADATDLLVRGPRHVAAAGGELVAVLPRDASVSAAGPLATAVLEARMPGHPLLLGLAAAGRDARRVTAWTDALARALAAEGASVLRVELAGGRSELPGLVEVIRDGRRLPDVVAYEPEAKLAHLTAGRDHREALDCAKELPARLPRDLDVLLVSLPSTVSRQVVGAAGALDHLLIVAERDRTSRVDLIAGLDALETVGTEAQVLLLDTETAMRLAPPIPADQAPPARPARRSIASTVGTPAVIDRDETARARPVTDEEPGPVRIPDDHRVATPASEVDVPAPGPEPEGDTSARTVGGSATLEHEAPEPEAPEPEGDEPVRGAVATPEPSDEAPECTDEAPEPGDGLTTPDTEVARTTDHEPGPGARDPALLDAALAAAARDRLGPDDGIARGDVVQDDGAAPVGPPTDQDGSGAGDDIELVGPGPDGPAPEGSGLGGTPPLEHDPDPDTEPVGADAHGDDTDRLQRVFPTAADDDEESLRTTAQLAILAQELIDRDRDHEGDRAQDTGSMGPNDR